MSEFKCEKCGKVCETKMSLGQHRRWCGRAKVVYSAPPGLRRGRVAPAEGAEVVARIFAAAEASLRESEALVSGCVDGLRRLVEETKRLRKAYIAKGAELRLLKRQVETKEPAEEET